MADFDAMLSSAFNDEGEPDLEALFQGVSDDGDVPESLVSAVMASDDFEGLLREHWSLPALDLSGELGRAHIVSRDGGDVRDDPFAADDYTDEQWQLVSTLKRPCLKAIDPSAKEEARDAAIRWIFEVGARDRNGLTFEATCRALGARPFVLQALIQHFWYLRCIHLPQGLPYLSRPLVEVLEGEAIFVGMEAGLNIARVVWQHPSISSNELLQRCTGGDAEKLPEYTKALELLCNDGILAARMGAVYFTSRHPERRMRKNRYQGKIRGVSWSESFFGDVE